ncbi:hypothetical protein LQ938_06575 [Microbacterium sp. cx-55]|uniref:hypothetical protein n=1 Tax=Microbacterium sp. cx-55 TaxID=2875948 RepID=UPI001CC0B1BF|nr:hypothetical protein [Microbacterium sp. cx-55]MBZ4486591.1 hypothetical protein [Microbacterium sp. cx-55]UGB36441.1 hypothetical protein LQ938_06575 [Microbacterium sp. cx-55]
MSDESVPPQAAEPSPPTIRPGQRYTQPYPGAAPVLIPSPSATYAPSSVQPRGRDPRPASLAIVAFCLAGVGALALPLVAVLAVPALLAGFICGLIAVIGRSHGGKGFGIAAIATSAGASALAVIGVIFAVAIGSAFTVSDPFGFAPRPYDAPYTDGFPNDGEFVPDGPIEYGAGLDLVAGEVVVTPTNLAEGIWNYGVVLDNPNPDAIFEDSIILVEGLDASGTVVDTHEQYLTIQPGPTAIVGSFLDAGDATITDVRLQLPDKDDARILGPDEAGIVTVEDVQQTDEYGIPAVTGRVVNGTPRDQLYAQVIVLTRDAEGTLISADGTYVDELPAGAEQTFELSFYEPLPAGATIEAYVTL